MQRYEKGKLGKLIVQDWTILAHYSEIPRLYILTDRQCAALISLATFLEWSTRYKNLPVDADIDAFASETKFNLMNPITCGMLQECLQPLFDTLRAQVLQDANFRDWGTDDPTGQPLPESSRTADQAAGSNPTCNLDILWAQCEQSIRYGVALVLDVLQVAEAATNNVELAAIFAQVPVLDELGADAIAGYVAFIQQSIADNYEAQVTETYIQEAACELFCLCIEDCTITLERLQAIFQARVEGYFDSPMGVLSTIGDFFGYFVGNPLAGAIIADAMHLLIWAGGTLTNYFLGDVGTLTLQTVLELAVNDGNSDWTILCNCGWISTPDFTISDYGFASLGGFSSGSGGAWVNGVGFVGAHGVASGNSYHMVQIALPVDSCELRYMKVVFDITNGLQEPGLPLVLATDTVEFYTNETPATDGTDREISATGTDDAADNLIIRVQSGFDAASSVDPGGTVVVKSAVFRGIGTKPSQLP